MSRSTMIAPSILASSRSPVAVNGHVEVEAAGGDRVDGAVAAEHDQRAGAAAQDPLQPVAQRGAGRDAPGSRAGAASGVHHRPRGRPLMPRGYGWVECRRSPPCGVRAVRSGTAAPALSSLRRHRRRRRPGRAGGGRAAGGRRRRRARRGPACRRRPRTRGSAGRAGAVARHHRDAEAEPGGLGQPLGQVADPAQLAGQPDLAHRDHAGRRGDAEGGRADRDGDGEVAGRLVEPGAADGRGEDVVGVQPDLAVLLQHGEHHRDPRGVEPGRRTPRPLQRGGGDQRLDLGQQRPPPLHRHGDAGAGHPAALVLHEEAGRVGDGGDPVGAQVEAADLVDRSEAVLHGADHPEPGVAVALEVQHHVDEVLEHPRTGDGAVLGHVADEHGGDVAGLGDPDQRGRDLLDLGDAAGRRPRRRPRRWSGWSRRPAASGRTCSMWVSTAPRSVSAARKSSSCDAVGAVGAQPDLGGRLLAGDVEDPLPHPSGLGGHLEQQGALADAGLAGQQDGGAGHQPAAEHPVELGHAAAARASTPRPRPGRSGPPARSPGSRRHAAWGRPPRPPSPRPGTHRSGLPTWRPPTRTRCSGRRDGARAWARAAT